MRTSPALKLERPAADDLEFRLLVDESNRAVRQDDAAALPGAGADFLSDRDWLHLRRLRPRPAGQAIRGGGGDGGDNNEYGERREAESVPDGHGRSS